MLEHIAKACGFSNWHAFQTLCSRVAADYAPPQFGSRPNAAPSVLEPFAPALPLLIRIGQDLPPDREERHGLESLGTRLAAVLALTEAAVMDILAKLHGADHWRQLLDRVPANSASPLYVFDIQWGCFTWSPACAALVEEMDALWQRYGERPKKEKQRARRFITEIVQKRPDFMEGWLAMGTIEELDGNDDLVGPIFDAAIKSAEALIPSGFDGEISWGEMDNRPYHRLLYNYMCWCIRHAELATAVTLAHRQLKLNPSDNLGVRIHLPLYLAVQGKHSAAKTALKRITTPDFLQDAHTLVIQSLCHLLAGDQASGKELFLRALFEMPALRPLLLDQTIPAPQDRQWYRTVIPDLESLWFDLETAFILRPNAAIEDCYRTLLNDLRVKAAEQEADRLFNESREGKGMSIDEWGKEMKLLAAGVTENLSR
jgi:hypothetical protein